MKVLVIDDSEDVRDLAAVILESDGHQITVAQNGPSGLELAAATRPDLILLDVFMDGWSGDQTLERLREKADTRSIPVAFLTGETRPAEKGRLIQLGAVGIVAKPFTPDTLIGDVRALLAGGTAGPGPSVTGDLLDENVLTQLRELADDDDPDFLAELIEAFVNDARTSITALENALRSEDRALMARQSHILKSSSGNAGAAALSRAAQLVESEASHGSWDELARLVLRLATLLAPTTEALRAYPSEV